MELLNDKLKVTLDNLGTTERTKPLDSANPMDAVFHEFRIASFLRNYGEKRYDKAKDGLKKAIKGKVTDAIIGVMAKVVKLKQSQSVQLIEAEHHTLVAQVNPGATYLDAEALKLKLKGMLPHDEVDAMFAAYTKQRDPATTYIVANKLEDKI